MSNCPRCHHEVIVEPDWNGWVAYCSNCYDGAVDSRPEIGHGSTQEESVEDFLTLLEEPGEEERSHCHVCGGSGQGHFGGTCPECRGWGVLPTEAELEEAAEAEIEAREWDDLV